MNTPNLFMIAIVAVAIGLIVIFFIWDGDEDDTRIALYFLGSLFTLMNGIQQYVL